MSFSIHAGGALGCYSMVFMALPEDILVFMALRIVCVLIGACNTKRNSKTNKHRTLLHQNNLISWNIFFIQTKNCLRVSEEEYVKRERDSLRVFYMNPWLLVSFMVINNQNELMHCSWMQTEKKNNFLKRAWILFFKTPSSRAVYQQISCTSFLAASLHNEKVNWLWKLGLL